MSFIKVMSTCICRHTDTYIHTHTHTHTDTYQPTHCIQLRSVFLSPQPITFLDFIYRTHYMAWQLKLRMHSPLDLLLKNKPQNKTNHHGLHISETGRNRQKGKGILKNKINFARKACTPWAGWKTCFHEWFICRDWGWITPGRLTWAFLHTHHEAPTTTTQQATSTLHW